MPPNVALLDASHDVDNASTNFHRVFDGRARVAEYQVTEGDLPGSFVFDAAVVSGSPASVYWDEAWIDHLEEWVRRAVEEDLPVLGVCFGHQLLARALGGEVRSMGRYELGYHMVHQDGTGRLFDGVSEWFVAFTAHSDEVTALPPGARPLASNNYSLHAFEREPAFGVQFHPEMDLETARMLMKHRGVDGEHIRHVLREVSDYHHHRAQEATAVFDNFLEYVRES